VRKRTVFISFLHIVITVTLASAGNPRKWSLASGRHSLFTQRFQMCYCVLPFTVKV